MSRENRPIGAKFCRNGHPLTKENTRLRKGKYLDCIICERDQENARYFANPKRKIATVMKWQRRNPEKVAKLRREFVERNRDSINAKKRVWYQKNREEILEKRGAWREANRERLNAYQREYRKRRQEAAS